MIMAILFFRSMRVLIAIVSREWAKEN
jgi:hypothetical protein